MSEYNTSTPERRKAWNEYMRDYSRKPEVRAKVLEYQKFYKCTDVFKSYKKVANARRRLSNAKTIKTIIKARSALYMALDAHEVTKATCGGIRGIKRKKDEGN